MPQSSGDPFASLLDDYRKSAPSQSGSSRTPKRGEIDRDALRTFAREFGITEEKARSIYEARGHTIVDAPADSGGDADPFAAILEERRAEAPADDRSLFARAYDAAFTAPKAVTDAARNLADRIDAPAEGRSRAASMLRGGVAGALQGAASLLTPGDAALLTLGPAGRLVKGGAQVARGVRGVQAAADVATVARGGERLLTAESPSEAAAGVAQIALGGASRAAARRPVPAAPVAAAPERLALPPGPAYIAGPEGVAPLGAVMPAPPIPDDPSFVRGVPAEYAKREVRGLLPPGPRFIAGEGGAIGALDSLADDPFAAVLAEVRRPNVSASASSVRSMPAAVLRETAGGRVRQYAGDPAAVSPSPERRQLSPEMESRLEAVRADARKQGATGTDDDLDALFLEKLSTAREAARDLEGIDAEADILKAVAERGGISLSAEAGGANARRAGLTGNRGELRQLMQDLDYGTSSGGYNARTGGVKATKYYQAGGVRGIGTIVNQQKGGRSLDGMVESLREAGYEVEDGNQLLDAIDRALVKHRRGGSDTPGVVSTLEGLLDVRPGGKWWQKPEEEYDSWARAFDEIAGSETGAARADVLARIGSTAGGGAAGAAAIEDDDPYWQRAAKVLTGAALGAAAPSLLRGGGSRSLPAARSSVLPMQRTVTKGAGGRPVVTYIAEKVGGVPRVGKSGTGTADPLAGVDTFLGKFSNPLVRDGIRERLEVNGGFADQRRNAVRADDVAKFSEAVKLDVTKALPKGSAASAEVITAYARGLRQTQERIGALAAKLNDGTATDADVLALEMARADGDVLLKSLMGLRGEAGRALGALRSIGGVFDSGNVELVRGAAQMLRDDAARFAQEFAKLPAGDDLARYDWLKRQGGATLWDKTRSYWYANLLSGVKTHERNILGNVFNALGNTLTHPVAAGLDAMKSAATGKPREILFSELPRGVMGTFAGIDRGLSDAVFTLRHGITPRALAKGMASAELGKLDLPRYEFAGGGANPFNYPGRALDAADAFFRSVARNAELYETAFTAAKREGLTGKALETRMSDLIAGTSPEAVALREQAEHVAARAVFQEKGGPITSFLARGYQVPGIGQAMTFTIPFLRTPGNILRQGLETSPAGFAMKEARSGGRAGALAQGKAAAGSLAAAYFAWLASTGRLSGQGPKDAKERARLMESGWRPNSVRIGDKWVGYQLFQPVSVQAAIVANAFEAWQDGGADDDDVVGLVGQTMARAANSFTEQSFLSGLSDFQQALNDPQRWGARWVGRTVQGMSPFAGMQRTITQGIDPKVRQARTVAESVKANTPGLSTSVPARMGRFGDDIEREGGPLRRIADPFNTSAVKRDPMAEELDRLGVDVTGLSAKMKLPGNRELSEDESRRVMQEQGRRMRAAIESVMGQQNYSRYPDKLRQSLIKRAIEKAREDVRKKVQQDVLRGRPVL
jgi:hypothetical protein